MRVSPELCDDLDGWGWGRGGREVHEGGDKPAPIAEALHSQQKLTQVVKQLLSNFLNCFLKAILMFKCPDPISSLFMTE